MASTEEVLSTLLADDYIHSSIQFLIDENMRTVTVPPEGVVLGVTGDKDVNRINFKMVRFYDGLDLSTFQIRINYVNANGDANYYQVTDTTVEEDYILFTWLVSSDAAAYKGTVSFAARLYTVEDTIVKESFNSTVATAEVLEGIIVDEYMPPDAQQDLIALLMSQIEFPAGVGRVDANSAGTGEIFNDYERNIATGSYSHAEGYYAVASGPYSHAEGFTTSAPGSKSHAEGNGTTASGMSSHAEGDNTTTMGRNSHAEGYFTNTSGTNSHAEGSNSIAMGTNSHAEGTFTIASSAHQHVQGKYNVKDSAGTYAMIIGNGTADDARSNALTVDWSGNIECGTINGVDVTQLSSGGSSGSGVGQIDATEGVEYHGEIFNIYEGDNLNKATNYGSHAEGAATTASGQGSHAEGAATTASGQGSHAEGAETTASGQSSHAEGSYTKASADFAHSEGIGSTASGVASHAEGTSTTASGNFSHAEGTHTTATCDNQHVQGILNVEDTDGAYAMIIGNGYVDSSYEPVKSNCFTVDWNGNIQCGKTDTSGNFITYGTINGVDVTQISGGSGVGQVDSTSGAVYHGEIFNGYPGSGYANSATGQYSHAEGQDTEASGNASHAEGQFTIASGAYSHAEGGTTKATGGYSHAEGSNTKASGAKSHAEGYYTEATADYSHAEGYYAVASGQYSHAEGRNTKASSDAQHVSGKFNVEDSTGKYAVIVGNGTADDSRSNALTVDWSGNIECGTVNGVDVTQISSGGSGSGVGKTDGDYSEIFNCYEDTTYGFFTYKKNVASGGFSHAEGAGTTASGERAHAEGYNTTASGEDAHAEGYNTTASESYAHAEGNGTTASGGYGSHAEGYNTTASGSTSHAEGWCTTASGSRQHVQGQFNVDDSSSKYAMIIGNGTKPNALSNGFTVDWDGNIQCGKTDSSGNLTTNGTINGIDIVALAARVAALEGTS